MPGRPVRQEALLLRGHTLVLTVVRNRFLGGYDAEIDAPARVFGVEVQDLGDGEEGGTG